MTEDRANYDTAVSTQVMEQVIVAGDLAKLTPPQRLSYYQGVCGSLGLNPFTKPFQYITLNGKLTLYATRDCTDQLRATRHVSVSIVDRERIEDVWVVRAKATLQDGRTDESIGAVTLGNKRGDDLANALMKAETKAKRRVTLSVVGLGWLDELETETIPDAKVTPVDTDTGEIVEPEPNARTYNLAKPKLISTDNLEVAEPLSPDIEAEIEASLAKATPVKHTEPMLDRVRNGFASLKMTEQKAYELMCRETYAGGSLEERNEDQLTAILLALGKESKRRKEAAK